MLGKGLESLIPKKQPGQSNQNQNYGGGVPVSSTQSVNHNTYQNEIKEEIVISEERYFPKQNSFDLDNNTVDKISNNSDVPMISGPVFHLEVDKIIVNPYQPRKDFDEEALKELATSIREFGILQPLVVTKLHEETENGSRVVYQLIAGHRRWLASKMLGLKTVPAIVRNPMKKTEALEMAIVENLQREDLHIIETARAYARLSEEFGMTQREIASRLGKSRETVANALRLLSLPAEIQDAIANKKVSESQARLLMQIDDQEKQIELFHKISEGGVNSVRELKKHIEYIKNSVLGMGEGMKVEDLEMKNIEKELSEFLGAPVKVEFSRSGGKITIHFYSPEEAMGIAKRIKPEEM